MSNPKLARRTAAVSAAFVLALGACGVAASAAFADSTPTTPVATTSAEPTDAPEAGDPTYTLTNNGAGSFSLAVTIPGTSIAVAYTVDPTGAVTGATTSTAGATVTVDGHDLTITLADGRAVKVELGDAVKEVSVDEKNSDNNQDTQDQQGDNTTQDTQDHQGNNTTQDTQDQQGADTKDAPATAEPKASSSDQSDKQGSSKQGSGSQDSASNSGDSGSNGSDSGN